MRDEARPAVRLTVLTAPSGVGGDSVVELIRARSPWLRVAVAVTTRPRREPEVDGVRYHFVDRAEFRRMIAAGELLEWAEVGGHHYGTSRAAVHTHLVEGRPVLLKTDPPGARQVRAAMPEAWLVFLAPSDDQARDAAGCGFDATVVVDRIERVVDELVGLLGSSFLAPAQPQTSG